MGTTYAKDEQSPHGRRNWTTIVLEERAEGRWLATQHGVSVEGYGESAADAAAAYCRLISEAGNE